MPSIRKSLLQLVFTGSFMKRWNDKLRPIELFEVDKQAHKMMVAWILLMQNTRGEPEEERTLLSEELIRSGIYDYLYRLVITDIKPPIFYQIKATPEHYHRLTEWVLDQLSPRIQNLGPEFLAGMRHYLSSPEPEGRAERMLAAAHLYASRYEFHLLKDVNPADDELEEIEESFQSGLLEYADLTGVPELLEGSSSPLGRFAQLCGKLRFQQRWSQTPRIPETTVLGHLFIVAAYAYAFSLECGACTRRRVNNFFSGLFHDLPEVLTRDIISPVKRSVAGISDLIREYEERELERRVFSLFQGGGHEDLLERLRYYLGMEHSDEFSTVVRLQGETALVDFDTLQKQYNADEFDPRDGGLVKVCDNLAAFIEAYTALRTGITSDQLESSIWRIRAQYQKTPFVHGIHIGSLLADFD
jgi:putative hydrolase of HD superfamily